MSTTLAEPVSVPPEVPGPQTASPEQSAGFRLALENFSGPFDLLLHLITKRELEITEVALAEVTDEFIGYIKQLQAAADDSSLRVLDETTEFLVVASTLLDLKAARLLPRGEMASEEDFELLEERDLLFARLLQYKAFKEAAGWIADRYDALSSRHPRDVALEEQYAQLLPPLVFDLSPDALAALAQAALAPKPEPATEVGVGHLHGAAVTIAQEAQAIEAMLVERGRATFVELVADADTHLVRVVRFLALLEMFRQRSVSFSQEHALGELTVELHRGVSFDAQALEDEYEAKGEQDHE
ncbi:hypothetical protein GCM10027417_24430 [Glutamicibacter endophyticus]